MPAWTPHLSGLTAGEITNGVNVVRSWRPIAPKWESVNISSGRSDRGKEIFLRECSMCHGDDGSGIIGPAINNQDLLSVASDRFLYQTIVTGRRNTAMPSFSGLKGSNISDLISFMRSWQTLPVRRYRGRVERGEELRGNELFVSTCARCHGQYGEGGIGPAILNRDFLDAASDEFILLTLATGRQHSPMFGMPSSGNVRDQGAFHLLSYMRSMRDSVLEIIPPGESLGQPKRGQGLFEELCSECHGKDGEGMKGPALNNQEFLNAASNGYLLATISLGRSETPMPAWGRNSDEHRRLSASERQDLVAFIRIWQTSIIRKP
jgi:mono/diheme cytochrome c family protein